MGKGLSLAGLIISIIGAFIPVTGLMIGWGALLLATLGAMFGGKSIAIATVAVSAFVFVFMTPSIWLYTAANDIRLYVTVALLALPIVGCFIGKKEQS